MRRSTVVLLAFVAVALLVLVPIGNMLVVRHDLRTNVTTATFPSAGLRTEMNGIDMTEDGTVHYKMAGEAPFNVYIVTYENYEKGIKNESFAYVGELSAFNVTSVDITGELKEGPYLFYIESLGAGNVTIYSIEQIYSPGGNVLLLWDMAFIITSTAILASLITYVILNKRK